MTFRSNAWGNITLSGDVALTLLKMMGHSGTVPSTLLARDIPSGARTTVLISSDPQPRRN